MQVDKLAWHRHIQAFLNIHDTMQFNVHVANIQSSTSKDWLSMHKPVHTCYNISVKFSIVFSIVLIVVKYLVS